MNQNSKNLISTVKILCSFDSNFLTNFINEIISNKNLTDSSKLALTTIIKDNTKHVAMFSQLSEKELSKLLQSILISDFTYFGLPAQLVPVVDADFRREVLISLKNVISSEIEGLEANLSSIKNSLSQIEKENILEVFTSGE